MYSRTEVGLSKQHNVLGVWYPAFFNFIAGCTGKIIELH